MHQPTVLMIHGLVGSLDYFDPAARINRATVRTCDLLGYGELGGVDLAGVTLQAQADHVAGIIDGPADAPVWLLGHSMGGAVAILAADRHPHLVCGIINVEGNFTFKDAFWSRRIAAQTAEEWAGRYRAMRDDAAGWLQRCGVEPNGVRAAWAQSILAHQSGETVRAMSRAILKETLPPDFPAAVRRVVQRGLPMHLIAGAKSASAWDVPEFVRRAAASYVEQPGVGHLMMLEDPDGFCRIVDAVFA